MNLHILLTTCQPQRNRREVRLFSGGKPHGGCPGGDIHAVAQHTGHWPGGTIYGEAIVLSPVVRINRNSQLIRIPVFILIITGLRGDGKRVGFIVVLSSS